MVPISSLADCVQHTSKSFQYFLPVINGVSLRGNAALGPRTAICDSADRYWATW